MARLKKIGVWVLGVLGVAAVGFSFWFNARVMWNNHINAVLGQGAQTAIAQVVQIIEKNGEFTVDFGEQGKKVLIFKK